VRPCVIYGGGHIGDQIMQLSKGCDLLIGTPGRLVHLINRPHVLTLKRLKYMIIDEADEMLGADWDTELKTIMSGGGEYLPTNRFDFEY
jgi:ATP-dependent RNA helicase DDX3X